MKKLEDTLKFRSICDKKMRISFFYSLIFFALMLLSGIIYLTCKKTIFIYLYNISTLTLIFATIFTFMNYKKTKKYYTKAQMLEPNEDVLNELYNSLRYRKGGTLYNWSNVTYKYNGKKYSINIWTELMKSGYFPRVNELVVYSPTAARGRYEKDTFKFLNKRNIKSHFILSDSNPPEGREKNEIIGESSFYYVNEPKNAMDLRECVERGIEPFNKRPHVIWDLKGCLWYAAEKNNNTSASILSIISEYYSLLADNGIVMIDAYKQNQLITEIFYSCQYHACKKLFFGYAETSTYSKIIKHVPELKKIIGHLFDIHEFGKGKYRTIIFVKKPGNHKEK
ncbi:hypothetical protein QJQ58_15625 [Paenibacillus dendritiformis]|uniref:hypothetical protein n=1 Tax=Paenibacillus dendritiformis TaxID=130049 RepID=UPI00248D15CA|nr:hypothetical protein [Paenibacillus dendritiformis]WGU92041.1 hypothetical protein QJQ58_15625 [Paenibacillus dendritiformis]